MLKPWLRLFRVVNLPTVPGDVLVGAAAFSAGGLVSARDLALASAASVFLYMFGLADNDIVGAGTDSGRPIPDGEISLPAAKRARAACLCAGLGLLAAGGTLMLSALAVAVATVAAVLVYNRTKRPLWMGACRGLNALLGAAVFAPLWFMPRAWERAPLAVCAVAVVVLVWTAYIAAVTRYSEGEETDPARRRRVGLLIEGIVHLQMLALVIFTLLWPSHSTRLLLVAGAVLLILSCAIKAALPKISAS